jgi:transposase InsO family protein
MESKHAARIIQHLVQAIRQVGFPSIIQTDNEACFNAWWFKLYLKLMGIKHKTSDIACPWQNGRIERFFKTFKQRFEQVNWDNHPQNLQDELTKFLIWYNCIRPHQSLKGLTPKEAFTGKRNKGNPQKVSDWHGVLTGYYFPD